MSEIDYSTVTELPGCGAHSEQLSVLYTRYNLAAKYAKDKDVLEVACGAGQGLGYLARHARRVVGGDIDENCLRFATEHYTDDRPIEVLKLDAQDLPFEEGSFDTVLLFEAIYYLPEARKFLQEAKRILRPGGVLLVSTVNSEWFGFNPSPFATRYYSAKQLRDILKSEGFSVRLFAAFPDSPAGPARRLISGIRKVAARFHLIPKTMKGKQFFKRLFYGKLVPLPHEVTDGMAPLGPLEKISGDESVGMFKFLYAVAVREA